MDTNEIAALLSHQAKISYGLMLLVVLVVGLAGFTIHHSEMAFQRELTHADDTYHQFQQDMKIKDEQIRTDEQQIEEMAVKSQSLLQTVRVRDQQVNKQISKVEAQTVPSDIAKSFTAAQTLPPGLTFSLRGDGTFEFNASEVAYFTATKLDRDRLDLNLIDNKKLLIIQQQTLQLTKDQNSALQSTLNECKTSLQAYKVVVKKDKLHRVLNALKIVGAVAVSAAIGHAI